MPCEFSFNLLFLLEASASQNGRRTASMRRAPKFPSSAAPDPANQDSTDPSTEQHRIRGERKKKKHCFPWRRLHCMSIFCSVISQERSSLLARAIFYYYFYFLFYMILSCSYISLTTMLMLGVSRPPHHHGLD